MVDTVTHKDSDKNIFNNDFAEVSCKIILKKNITIKLKEILAVDAWDMDN